MPEKTYEYIEKDSGIFGKVLRPLIDIEAQGSEWIRLDNVLADTGADISILPRDIGELLVGDITKGRAHEVRGIVPYAKLIVFIHNIKIRINGRTLELSIANPTSFSETLRRAHFSIMSGR